MFTFSLDHSKAVNRLKNMGIKVFTPYEQENQIQTFKSDGWYLRSFPLPHGDCSCYGTYVVSPEGFKLVYASDFQHIPYVFKKLAINTFLIECNHMDEINKELNEGKWEHSIRDHSSLSVVKEFLKVNQTDSLKSVILCHLSMGNADPEVMLNEVKKVVGDKVKVYIAKRGLEVEL